MDVSLLRVGVYTVYSESGQTYHVDVFERSCTCPDWSKNEPEGGCKHMRRVDLDIDAGVVPRPDGRLVAPKPRSLPTTAGRPGRRPLANSWSYPEATSSKGRSRSSIATADIRAADTSDADIADARRFEDRTSTA